MAIFKPATPGFLTTLTATVLLGVVSFSVPYFKTIYFLQASYNTSGQSGLINIGTLGYCLVINGAETCTKPSIGYEFSKSVMPRIPLGFIIMTEPFFLQIPIPSSVIP